MRSLLALLTAAALAGGCGTAPAPEGGEFAFDDADALVDWATEHGGDADLRAKPAWDALTGGLRR